MKTSILIFAGILISVLLIAHSLTGNVNPGRAFIQVPASIVEGDTLAVVDLPVVTIYGNK